MKILKDTKYNYVFFNTKDDFLKPVYVPLRTHPNIQVFDYAFESYKFVFKLFFYWWSAKVNRIIHIPLKKIWFKKICETKFNDKKPVCYVFPGGKYILDEPKLYDYIKRINPENKCIIYFGDLISKRNINIERAKKCSDYIVSYDIEEAEKYDIYYYDDLSYGALIDVTTPDEFENDIYFLGFAKDRLDDIHNVFHALKNNGFNCKFIVCGVEKEKQLNEDGILYRKPIPYIENLENVRNSKCIVELIQHGSDACTLRQCEAQVYRRKFLTNNVNIVNKDYFDSINMSAFNSIDDIDYDFIRKPIDYNSFTKNDIYDPYRRIEYFESLISEE